MKSKIYFSSGELAKYTGITKDALFHYEKNELIHPEIIKDNGYRYYTSDQFDILNTIVILRNAGVSISDIKAFLEENTLEELYKLYDEREKEIDEKIALLKKTKELLKNKKANIKLITQSQTGVVVHEYMKKEKLELSNESVDDNDHAFDKAVSELMLKKDNIFTFSTSGAIVSDKTMKEQRPHYKYLYMPSQNAKYIKPEGEYLVIYHKGYFEDCFQAYKLLYDYVKENEIEVEEDLYEQVMLESLSIVKNEPFIIKIMAKIK